jgi:hypothetical protein
MGKREIFQGGAKVGRLFVVKKTRQKNVRQKNKEDQTGKCETEK